MNIIPSTRRTVLATWLLMAPAMSFAQGPLTPPGAPAPTMKTLDQIEPRVPITNVPYAITHPGSYYLAANLTSTGHGVVITVDDVTLDLMGFTIRGDRDSSDYGIYLQGSTNSPVRNATVRNGVVRDFGRGLLAAHTLASRFERLICATNLFHGISLDGASGGQCVGNTIVNNTTAQNDIYGIRLEYAKANRVENNHITALIGTNTTYGILCIFTEKNFILRNACVGHTTNYVLGVNDTYGPIVTNTGALAVTGAAAHAWANFSR